MQHINRIHRFRN